MTHFSNTTLLSGAMSASLLLLACTPNQTEPLTGALAEPTANLTGMTKRKPAAVLNRQLSPESVEEFEAVLNASSRPITDRPTIVSQRLEKHRENQAMASNQIERRHDTSTMQTVPSSASLATDPARPMYDMGRLMPAPLPGQSFEGEQYAELENNRTIQTRSEPVSTFSIDVDTGAYANVRRFLENGQLPPKDAVRAEELLNYFSYNYEITTSTEQPFSVVTELGPTPWNKNTQLLHIGLKGFTPSETDTQAANLVFLVDVSGSMNSPDKLGLLKSSISLMAHEMTAADTLGIVVYAGSSGVVLEPTAGNQHATIDRALAKLTAGGSTNGQQGIELAYQLASDNFIDDGVNRVILATDGDFNVGISDVNQLKTLIAKKRETGIALTTLGFGSGNYNDHLMEQLADIGNGSYAYIDTLGEARKVLVEERHATLLTIAKDVKIQVEFNPTTVSEYRLIGYTNRQLANEDFNNDKVDAGEIGAGHTVTALYEVALIGGGGGRHSPRRYSDTDDHSIEDKPLSSHSNELAEVRLRYKLPSANTSRLTSRIVNLEQVQSSLDHSSENFRFSASVAAFSQLLRGSSQLGAYDYKKAYSLAQSAKGEDKFGYRAEFARLIDMARSLDQMQRATNGARPANEG